MLIRPARKAEWPEIARVFIAARAGMTYLPKPHSDEETRAFIGSVVGRENVWVAEGGGCIRGFAAMSGPSKEAWLDHLYVHPREHDAGAGTLLLARVKRECPEGFSLWTFQANLGARRFYERHGLNEARRTDGAENEEKLPDILYEWRERRREIDLTDNAKKPAKDLETENKGALKGVRIVDLTAVVFGAYATQILGDMGADVIKIEAPSPTGGGGAGGDIMRWPGHPPEGASAGLGPIFMTINRNKRSVVLDLGSKQGRDALLKVIATADVLTSNIRYAAMTKLGLSYEDVKAVKPDIIFVHAAGYGSDGPYAGLPAYDDLIQAGSGAADLLGRMDGDPKPRYIPTIMADKASGLFMVSAVTAALFHRARSGEGQFVEVPMLEAVTSFILAEHFYDHVYDPPTGQWSYSRITNPDRRPYKTKDGHIGLLPYSDKQWEAFFKLAGRLDDYKNDPRFNTYKARTVHIRDLYAMIEETTQTKTTAEWLALLQPLSIPAVKMNRLDDLQDDPHLKAVDFFARYDHPDAGPYFALKPPVRFGASPSSIRRHPPRLGQQTAEVLREAGMSETEIEALTGGEAVKA